MDSFFLAPVPGDEPGWTNMSREDQKRALRRKQRDMLSALLERGAISRIQYELGLRALQGRGNEKHG